MGSRKARSDKPDALGYLPGRPLCSPLWKFSAREVNGRADREEAASGRGSVSWPEKLKSYQTSLGFFDLAMAAPSMKAALEAWGADSNLFHQGAAKESHDPDIIAATMAKPGVVLRRPVGADRPFSEHAELPTDLGAGGPRKAARKSKGPKAKKSSSRPVDKAAEQKAALAYERERRRRELERAKEEAARQKDRERRQQAVEKAQAALDKAEREHAKQAAAIQTEIEALEKRSQTEEAGGIRRRSDWKPRCGARGVSFCCGTPRVKASDHLQPFIFRDLVRLLRLGSPRRGPIDPQERAP